MSELPRGTVTFLFTDIEGSTQLLKRLGGQYGEVLAEHQRILRAAFAAHHGREVDTQGDSFFVAFQRGKDAVAAAADAQRDLAAHPWAEGVEVKVRMGLHTGEPRVGQDRYVGLGVHKAARIGASGHGGQVLLSRTTRDLVEDELPPGVTIRDLGERRLKDLDRPERLAQLEIEGLPSVFGPLKTLDVELARKRRRTYAGAALIGVLAAAVAIPVFAFGQGDAGGGAGSIEPNTVAVIDASSNEVDGSVPVGVRPSVLAAGEGAVWVGNVDDESLSRIDPESRTRRAHDRAARDADGCRGRAGTGLGRPRNPRICLACRPVGERCRRDDRRSGDALEHGLDRGGGGRGLVRLEDRHGHAPQRLQPHDRPRGDRAERGRRGRRCGLDRELGRQRGRAREPADEHRGPEDLRRPQPARRRRRARAPSGSPTRATAP